MMKTTRLLAVVSLLIGVSACNNSEEISPANTPVEIKIDASIDDLTRVMTTGNASSFENGDQISVYAWTGDQNNVLGGDDRVVDGSVNTYDGTKWEASPQMLWKDMTTEHYFLAVYPSHEITNFEADPYTLNTADQMTSDLLIAVNNSGLKAQDNPVPLIFDHAMAKLVVNLHFRNQWADTPDVESVVLDGYTEATVNYLLKTVTGTTTGKVGLIRSEQVPDNFEMSYSSIVIPSTDTKTIRIRIDGAEYVYNHDDHIPLTSGKYTTVNLTIGRDAITPADVKISDWEKQGDPITGEVDQPATGEEETTESN